MSMTLFCTRSHSVEHSANSLANVKGNNSTTAGVASLPVSTSAVTFTSDFKIRQAAEFEESW